MHNVNHKLQTAASWINHIAAAPEHYYPVWLGYNDKRAGRGFSKEYEDKTTLWQSRYEIGRLLAVDLDFLAPSWPKSTIFPPAIRRAFVQVIQTNPIAYNTAHSSNRS